MENKKYEFTGETKEFGNYTLHRIRALVDIENTVKKDDLARALVDIKNFVKKGELGGWIESEENLSHEGCCWVDEGCHVCGGARVYDNAHVAGKSFVALGSEVYGNAYIGELASVTDGSKVYGSATVTGKAIVINAEVYGDAYIDGNTIVAHGAKVFDNAMVGDRAKVDGEVVLHGSAKVSAEATLTDGDIDSTSDFICIGPIGSRNAYTTYNLKSGTVSTGCFTGPLKKFKEKVAFFHGKLNGRDEHYKAYNRLIDYFKTIPLRTTGVKDDHDPDLVAKTCNIENKKYEFTGETKEFGEYTLRRIRALVDIKHIVKKGELGGWIEDEENLSHEGNCWVNDGCYVCGGARVYDNAHIAGGAKVLYGSEVYGDAYICICSEVAYDSKVYGSAVVSGGSLVINNAEVYGNATIVGGGVVSDGAKVFGAAIVDHGANVNGKAVLSNIAKVSGDVIIVDGDIDSESDFICVGPIGSRRAYTTYNLKSGTVCTGCFVGTLEEFEKQVISTYGADGGEDTHYKSYKNLIEYFKTIPLRTTEQEKD